MFFPRQPQEAAAALIFPGCWEQELTSPPTDAAPSARRGAIGVLPKCPNLHQGRGRAPRLGVTPRLCFTAQTSSKVPNYGKSAEKAALAHRTGVLGIKPTVPKPSLGDATLPQHIPRTVGHIIGAQHWKRSWGSAAGGSGALVSSDMAGERAGRRGWQKPPRGGRASQGCAVRCQGDPTGWAGKGPPSPSWQQRESSSHFHPPANQGGEKAALDEVKEN